MCCVLCVVCCVGVCLVVWVWAGCVAGPEVWGPAGSWQLSCSCRPPPACLPACHMPTPRLPASDVSEEVAELAGRVQVAAAYMARIGAALRGKQGQEEVEAIVAVVGGCWYFIVFII